MFIIGSGRYGTSLLDSILNSHPKLFAIPDKAISHRISLHRLKRFFYADPTHNLRLWMESGRLLRTKTPTEVGRRHFQNK